MIWVFRDLNEWITRETGIPCLLPGQVTKLHEPHVYYVIRSFKFGHPSDGQVEHDELIAAGHPYPRYQGASPVEIQMELSMAAFGTSPDFAFGFYQALRKLAKIIKEGVITVPIVTQQRGRAGGLGLVVGESASGNIDGVLDGVSGTLWAAAWECSLIFPQREDDDYTVDPIVYETEPGDGPVPIG